MNDPRAAEAAHRYIRILNEFQSLGKGGFAVMLDTASPEEMSQLLAAAEVIQAQIDRTRTLL